jgi:hypothetical protein
MIGKKLTTAEIEAVYDLIAQGIDRAGETHAKLFLAKLCLALANLVGSLDEITQAVEAASRDLESLA